MRHVKQLIYGIFYLAFWVVLFSGVYFWQRPAPSCFDGRQNQNETGVDCGGVCSRACIPVALSPLTVASEPKMILFGTGSSFTGVATSSAPRVSLVAEVRNSNVDFAASKFDYSWSVLDRNGAAIASFPGSSFIYAGGIKYLTLLNAALPPGSDPAAAKIDLGSAPQWSPAERFPRPKLDIQSLSTGAENANLVARGVLVNNDSISFQEVYLTALFYDQAGRIVAVSGTESNNVTSGESREFALFHPFVEGAALERTRVFATAFNPR